jgi:hypothetical protein
MPVEYGPTVSYPSPDDGEGGYQGFENRKIKIGDSEYLISKDFQYL